MKMLRLEQVAYVLVSRGADVGIVELHRDVWAGVARMYDLETDVVLAETPRTMRRLINLRAARLALRRAERKRQEAEATIRRNRRLIAEITDALPARLVERVSDSD